MDTKQKILLEALRLFSQRGYDAVSVEQIAAAVGIKAPSLYKHYKSKQDIFHAIFDETARRYDEFTDTISVHVNNSEEDAKTFEEITEDDLVEKVKALISYSLHDEYVSRFRRMMTIEQYRSKELSDLYSQRYVHQIHNYHTELFGKMIAAGVLAEEDPCILAMMYDAPILVLLGECDRHPEKEEECRKKLEAHVRLFYRTFNSRRKG
ncbi:TetR/AcrR family transcriptional regulator [Fusibacillus kribbianus]|uniref:TetR/AcrR family transcriptional regulator n=1 Tax=Fusibacillus kribbianus TaxID=3044208 RepID=A0AAP4BBA5_9FIRM|nr:TetR/AcrR family transcriptional regulator [Ruminococcus sp. YH-rum2234]MDI9241294.1 TetR/AcrR family transcriptional regulator [Ruminococcus sp. YH-rum2234]